MSSTNGQRYRFDIFEVDPANRILLRSGHDIHVTGRVFDILLIFIENPGRLLEKAELMEKVWTSDFVEEGNLTRNISSLRKALGDTARDHKYIATVQGHGYRFVADVRDIGDEEVRAAILAPPPERPIVRSSIAGHLSPKWLRAVLVAVLLIASILEVGR